MLPNMGLTASNEAIAEACRHPASRFNGPGSLQESSQSKARQGKGKGCGRVSLAQLAAPARAWWGPVLFPVEGQFCSTAPTPALRIPSQHPIQGGAQTSLLCQNNHQELPWLPPLAVLWLWGACPLASPPKTVPWARDTLPTHFPPCTGRKGSRKVSPL